MERVLLLEDDPDVAEPLCELLRATHQVTHVASGAEALAVAGRERFDVAIVDFDVQELSGEAVLRVVHDLAAVPVVVISAQARGWRRPSADAGAVALLPKPFPPARLFDLLEGLLRESRTGAPWPADVTHLPPGDLATLAAMSQAELDALPFGVFRLSRDGIIERYNAFESQASGRDPRAVIGKSMRDVAPCVLVQEFVDAVARGRRGEPVDAVLRFVFPWHGAEVLVNVRVYFDARTQTTWLFVSRRGAGAA